MLKTFLIIRDRPAPKQASRKTQRLSRFQSPYELLGAAGLKIVETVQEETSTETDVSNIDAVLFDYSYSAIVNEATTLEMQGSFTPLLWWCEDEPHSLDVPLPNSIDGLLFPSMTLVELQWTLLQSTKQFRLRTQWKQEREQLLTKLDDRRWIDRAKSIISEVKSISEAEAYEFLRKQAMNERKRMVDVALSIVKVYALIRDENPRGAKKNKGFRS